MFTKELLSDATLLKGDDKIEADMMSDHSGSDSDPAADTLGNKDLETVLPEQSFKKLLDLGLTSANQPTESVSVNVSDTQSQHSTASI
jgi:hypothetical protein